VYDKFRRNLSSGVRSLSDGE